MRSENKSSELVSDFDSALRTPHSALPTQGRLLGVDFGTVRIGLAVCDPDRIVASALDTHVRKSEADDTAYFQSLVRAERLVGFVVGLPISLNGTEGPKAKEAREFGTWLSTATGLPVVFSDERFTTAAADDALRQAKVRADKRTGKRDRIAAQIILQSFLDAGCPATL
ncbi:MAG TPA: Holliday junction resolvase RuvX [Fimbriiglobus sp.]|jgi:putative Holliday junction resolvase